ncbi:Hypothetical protein NTJ_07970 [Nesidiocoris tenuis]|uniref:Uncharacterized protein n=1 Tax=Nesidiocoris tenuis TaxID=355587 RepID=A0ABN7AWB2_9HEMI|nr:Hypothetical protein NTJ_07970 [Nesidiocoris tenuis]
MNPRHLVPTAPDPGASRYRPQTPPPPGRSFPQHRIVFPLTSRETKIEVNDLSTELKKFRSLAKDIS